MAVDAEGRLWERSGVSYENPTGTQWVEVDLTGTVVTPVTPRSSIYNSVVKARLKARGGKPLPPKAIAKVVKAMANALTVTNALAKAMTKAKAVANALAQH